MADAYHFIQCRTIGHSWDQIPTTRRPSFGVLITLRCTHCGTIREDIVQAWSGDLLSRSYHHPDGYKHEHTSRSEWRKSYVASLPRSMKKESE